MKYGPVLAAAFILWPVMAVLGGQGFAPLIGLTGLAALFVARPKLPPAVFALFGFAFIAWAALSELWTPGQRALISGSLLDNTFSVEARSVSTILLALTSALTVAAVLRTEPAPRASAVVTVMLVVQGVLVIASAAATGQILTALYGDDIHRHNEAMQNIGRSANVLALALPLLVPLLIYRWNLAGKVFAALLSVAAAAAFLLLGSDSAFFAIFGISGGILIVGLLPKTGFRWLFGLIAGYISAAPMLFAVLIRGLDPVSTGLPDSFRSRLWSWESVIARLPDAPLTGHGLNATRQWNATFETRPDWLAQLPAHWKDYPIVPGHPHNMALQIWAETGLIGAFLAAMSLVALSIHLPRPEDLRPEIRFAAAGLAGAAIVIFSFAYSLWNEGFWSALALASAAIILWHRTLKDIES